MNRTCPLHGFRDLGTIIQIKFVADGRTGARAPKKPKEIALERLLEEYWAVEPSKGKFVLHNSHEAGEV